MVDLQTVSLLRLVFFYANEVNRSCPSQNISEAFSFPESLDLTIDSGYSVDGGIQEIVLCFPNTKVITSIFFTIEVVFCGEYRCELTSAASGCLN